MLIENSDALKKYLMESLGRLSDADPGALTRYILALLKKPRSEDDLKVFFLDQLEVFLTKDTAKFVDELFEAIKSKSYLPIKERESIPMHENSENSEKDCLSSKNMKSKRKEEIITGAESLNKRKRSSSISSRSRSSSPEKSKERINSLATHVYNTVTNENKFLKKQKVVPFKCSPEEVVYSQPDIVKPKYTVEGQNEKLSKRCKDYDERGYCLLGDSCRFNHGLDPLIVEDVSVLNFAHVLNDHVTTSLNICEAKEVPLPPLPPPASPPPPPPPSSSPLPTSGIEYIPEPYNPECPEMECKQEYGNYYSVSLQRSFQVPSLIPSQTQSSIQTRVQNSKPLRSRELIGVPTVDCKKRENELQSFRKRNSGFNYHHLSLKPKRIPFESTSTIELRRIPPELNTISHLHDHFSSFGKIMNIQLCYDDDPEASLITFATAAEATAAYKSTQAVLNNRFIKVLLHDPSKRSEKKNEICERKEDYQSRTREFTSRDYRIKKGHLEPGTYSIGNLSKTVFRSNNKNDASSLSAQAKVPKEERKQALSKLDLYKKKQEFLEAQIQHQRLIVERFKTTRSAKQRAALKKIIDDTASKITTLQNDLKYFFEKEKCNSQTQITAIAEKKKELLDAEMDLYKTLNKSDESDTSTLMMRVNELKAKAKEFGLLDSFEKTGLKAEHPKPHGFSSKPVSNFSKLLKTDNRPKTVLVSGFKDKDFLMNFLQKYPGVEKINLVPRGCTVILNTRKAAEVMLCTLNGFTLGDENLSVTWFLDEQQSVSEDIKDTPEEHVEMPNFVDGDEDDDEEEDSEARSWRR